MSEEKKTIWIINQYGSLPSTGIGGRHRHLSRELAQLGHNVTLISARWTHGTRDEEAADKAPELESFEGFRFLRIPAIKYQHAHDKKRILNWFSFAWRIRRLEKKLGEHPDVILYSSPAPVAFLSAHHLAKKFNSRLVFEVRDIWPQTLVELGGYSRNHLFIRFLQWIEDRAYRKADRVVSNLKNAVEHMASRGMDRDKFTWVPNGFSLDEVNLKTSLNEKSCRALPKDKFIIGYTGTLGVANAMDTFIEAAERLKEHQDIAFVLVGRGKEKDALQEMTERKGLQSVHFIDPIPKAEVQSMLAHFDACYIGWNNSALYNFGIGANKITEYFYSGRPIIHSYSGACDPVVENDCGIQVDAEDPAMLAEAIVSLYQKSPEERHTMGERGRAAALEQYEYSKLAKKLEGVLFND